ncbi:uncharacterized protein LOC116260193 [Nymphaea colorata]|nr:uncharacterized protein LOC116260193 [Nymphaea colorata]
MSGKGFVEAAGKTIRMPTVMVAIFVCIILIWISDGSGIDEGIRALQRFRDLRIALSRNLRNDDGSYDGDVGTGTKDVCAADSLTGSGDVDKDRNTSNVNGSVGSGETSVVPWISIPIEKNITARAMQRLGSSSRDPCQNEKTTRVSVSGLDAGWPELPAGKIHRFLLRTYSEAGRPRCAGGDFFEVDLSGESWKSRPPLIDNGNGSYALSLQVHPDFPGDYSLTVRLLFRSYEGTKFHPNRFAYDRLMLNTTIRFTASEDTAAPPELKLCGASDFDRDAWSGRWTRLARNDTCDMNDSGRFLCLPSDHPCRAPWCDGALGTLESNGWVYSAHCAFRIFHREPAWRCLSGRWLFFWGDSNHVDTIRNLLTFVLGVQSVESIARRFNETYRNPADPSQYVHITSIFNGHSNVSLNFEGLSSLDHPEYRDLLRSYFAGSTLPDVIVMNSGLHDGIGCRRASEFAENVARAAEFWDEVLDGRRKRPLIIYRTTVTVAGYTRPFAYNPQKMELYNGMVLEGFRRKGLVGKVVDAFDMTFPWHYDNNCSDGPHYGRPPAKSRWTGGQIGHQYFVDLMLVHVLLNAICPLPTR